MHRLTREVRFAVDPEGTEALPSRIHNGYAGWPPLRPGWHYLALAVTLEGELDPKSNYLLNIKQIDQMVRQKAIPLVSSRFGSGILRLLFDALRDAWPGLTLREIRLALSPFLSLSMQALEYPMVRYSQKFEFSAAHRLHNPEVSDEENRQLFGKCNNEHMHGHNYELQVTLKGEPKDHGTLIAIDEFERIVAETVIDRFDHKNLNVELAEFREVIPSVENIAMVIYRLLRPQFAGKAQLASVTVWETPKTWCEYWE